MATKITATFRSVNDIDLQTLIDKAIDIRIEQVAGPKRRASRARASNGKAPGLWRAIMKHYIHNGRFDMATAEKWVAAENYASNGASPTISRLTKAGYLRREGTSIFFVKPLEEATPAPQAS